MRGRTSLLLRTGRRAGSVVSAMSSAVQDSDRPQGNTEAEAKPEAAAVGAPSHPSGQSEGVLAALSTMINDNLGVFR